MSNSSPSVLELMHDAMNRIDGISAHEMLVDMKAVAKAFEIAAERKVRAEQASMRASADVQMVQRKIVETTAIMTLLAASYSNLAAEVVRLAQEVTGAEVQPLLRHVRSAQKERLTECTDMILPSSEDIANTTRTLMELVEEVKRLAIEAQERAQVAADLEQEGLTMSQVFKEVGAFVQPGR